MCVTEYSLIINGPHKCKYWTSWNQTYHLIIYTPTFSRPPRTCSMAMLVCLQVGAYRWPFPGKSKATQRPKKCLATQQSPGKVWYSLLLNWHAREFPSLFPRHGVTFQYLMIGRFFFLFMWLALHPKIWYLPILKLEYVTNNTWYFFDFFTTHKTEKKHSFWSIMTDQFCAIYGWTCQLTFHVGLTLILECLKIDEYCVKFNIPISKFDKYQTVRWIANDIIDSKESFYQKFFFQSWDFSWRMEQGS